MKNKKIKYQKKLNKNYNSIDRTINRQKKRRRKIKRKFFIRRILLVFIITIFLIIIYNLGYFIFNLFNNISYPKLRKTVFNDIKNSVFISDTTGRSLTSSEKKSDFDYLYDVIYKTFPLSDKNKKFFSKFLNQKVNFEKNIIDTKTDEEFFNSISKYLELLKDENFKILDKNEYDKNFNYYKNLDDENPWKKEIEKDNSRDRYERMVEKDYSNSTNIQTKVNNTSLIISFDNFNKSNIKDDKEKIVNEVNENPFLENIIIDLRQVTSTDEIYWKNALAPIFIKKNSKATNQIIYRSNLNDDYIDYLSNSNNMNYSNKKLKTYSLDNIKGIDIDDYMFYNNLNTVIEKDNQVDMINRNVYILVDSNTKNAPESFSSFMQTTGNATIVGENTFGNGLGLDQIFISLPHSGFIIQISTCQAINYYGKLQSNSGVISDIKVNSKENIDKILNQILDGTIEKNNDIDFSNVIKQKPIIKEKQ